MFYIIAHVNFFKGHIVKEYIDYERKASPAIYGLFFPTSNMVRDSQYQIICYTSHGALARMSNSSKGPP